MTRPGPMNDDERKELARLRVWYDDLVGKVLIDRSVQDAAQKLSEAATEVNARYIGGSPLSGRLGEALDELAAANGTLERTLWWRCPGCRKRMLRRVAWTIAEHETGCDWASMIPITGRPG